MLFYKNRILIEKLFAKWCEENGVAYLPNSLVAYMEIKGWLNIEKILADLKEET